MKEMFKWPVKVHVGVSVICVYLMGQLQMFYACSHFFPMLNFKEQLWNNPETMCLFSPHAPHPVFLFGDWQRRTRVVAPWGAPVGSFPALISPVVTPLLPEEVEVLEAWAAVGSVSGPSWQIRGTPSPWCSQNFRWRRRQIIWKWKDLNHQPSGESSCEKEWGRVGFHKMSIQLLHWGTEWV